MSCCPDTGAEDITPSPSEANDLAWAHLSRRRFLGGLAVASASLVVPGVWSRAAGDTTSPQIPIALPGELPRELTFHHTHTAEELRIVYWQDGNYVQDGLAAVSHFLRDFRTGDQVQIDPHLLDVLHTLALATGTKSPFHVISGYRSPQTNARLRKRRRGVARNSQHLRGRAIDVRLEDVNAKTLRDTAIALGRGGVGYYARSRFVHVDTGPVRTW